jgi:hypothetical protein
MCVPRQADSDAAKGLSFSAIKQRLPTTAPTIILWKERFLARGTDGLDTFHPGQKPTVLRSKFGSPRSSATPSPAVFSLPEKISPVKLRRYINAYSANAKPIQWKYSDPTRRIRTNDFIATGH